MLVQINFKVKCSWQLLKKDPESTLLKYLKKNPFWTVGSILKFSSYVGYMSILCLDKTFLVGKTFASLLVNVEDLLFFDQPQQP